MKFLNRLLLRSLRLLYRAWRRFNIRQTDPRLWSNDELAKFAPMFSGDVINVSGGRDSDKEGRSYREYFQNAQSYTLSNYILEFKGSDAYQEIELDLSKPLSSESQLAGRFEAVLSHTVLEHIYEVHQAVENLCKLSNDVVITVIPFLQEFHHVPDQYHDYWRISPYSLALLFKEHGFQTLYVNWNDDPLGNIYVFHIASRQPEKWAGKIHPADVQYGPGSARLLIHPEQDGSTDRTVVDPGDLYPAE